MAIEHINGFNKVYQTLEYDHVNKWAYSNWIGYQTYIGIVAAADSCLHVLLEHNCSLLLNDNREVVGPWDHAVEWIVTNWAPRAIAQGLTHFANVVSPGVNGCAFGRSHAFGYGWPTTDAFVRRYRAGERMAARGAA